MTIADLADKWGCHESLLNNEDVETYEFLREAGFFKGHRIFFDEEQGWQLKSSEGEMIVETDEIDRVLWYAMGMTKVIQIMRVKLQPMQDIILGAMW